MTEVHSRKVKLLGFLPIYSWRNANNKKIWKVLGIEIFKKRFYQKGVVKYYFLGIPFMTATEGKV